MDIVYSDHARKRMKQRGITELEVEHILKYPTYVKKSFEETKEAFGKINKLEVKIEFIQRENYIKIITVM